MAGVFKRVVCQFIVSISLTIFVSALDVCDPDVPSRPTPYVWLSHAIFKNCEAGTYKDIESDQCLQCPDGHFMTKQMAESSKFSFCEKCITANSFEVVAEPCSKTRDSVIRCRAGYYRRRIDDRQNCSCCWACSQCDVCGIGTNLNLNFQKRECNITSNTLCCHLDNMVVVGGSCEYPSRKSSGQVEKLTNKETLRESQLVEQDSNISVAVHDNAGLFVVCVVGFITFHLTL